MNKKDLLEYNQREKKYAEKLLTDNFNRLTNSDSETLSHLDFYPEIKSKLEKKVYTNWLIDPKTIFVQLPFYDTIIFPIKPLPTENMFKKTHGIDIEQTIDLTKKGKIVPLPTHNPLAYETLDYLDPILELRNPTITHRMASYNICRLMGVLGKPFDQMMDWVNEGERLAEKLDLRGAHKLHTQVNKTLGKNAKNSTDPRSSMGIAYAHLNLMGYSELASQLIDYFDSELVYAELQIFENLLHRTPCWALDGTQSILERDCQFAKIWDVELKPYPVDIGKLLTKEFKLLNIRDVGFEKIIDITKQTTKARRSLFELNNAVENIQTEQTIDRAKALEKTWIETNEIINSMIKKKEKIKKYLPIFLGVVGPISGLINAPGIIQTLTDTVESLHVISPIKEKILKIKKPSHIVAIYDLKNSGTV